jgi:hypothetical protein
MPMPSREPQQRPTLESVARLAAVSRQTVSNVLNAPHLVRPATRERVQRVIAETGYRPVKAAQTLRTRRSQLIAVGLRPPGVASSELLDSFLRALTAAAQQRGYRIMLYPAGDDDTEIGSYGRLLSEYDLDAFVLTDTHPGDKRTDWLHRRRRDRADQRRAAAARGGPRLPGRAAEPAGQPARPGPGTRPGAARTAGRAACFGLAMPRAALAHPAPAQARVWPSDAGPYR